VAAVMPGTVALVDEQGEHTYAELDRRVDRVAGALVACGVRQGDRVAMLAWNAPEVVELVHAAARIGAILVPLNARLRVEELAFQMRDAEVTLLVCDASLAETGATAAKEAGTRPPRLFPLEGGAGAPFRGWKRTRATTRFASCTPPGQPGCPRVSS